VKMATERDVQDWKEEIQDCSEACVEPLCEQNDDVKVASDGMTLHDQEVGPQRRQQDRSLLDANNENVCLGNQFLYRNSSLSDSWNNLTYCEMNRSIVHECEMELEVNSEIYNYDDHICCQSDGSALLLTFSKSSRNCEDGPKSCVINHRLVLLAPPAKNGNRDDNGSSSSSSSSNFSCNDNCVHLPLQFSSGVIIRSISCGTSHTLMTSSNGELFSYGHGSYGQLGLGDATFSVSSPEPVLFHNFQANKACRIIGAAAGHWHSLCVDELGKVWSFGRGSEGQLGDGRIISAVDPFKERKNNNVFISEQCCCTPFRVSVSSDEEGGNYDPVILVACALGGLASYALTLHGKGYRWGAYCNNFRERCHGDVQIYKSQILCPNDTVEGRALVEDSVDFLSSSVPSLLPQPLPQHHLLSISAGSDHMACYSTTGEAFTIGVAGPHLGVGPVASSFDWLHSSTRMLLPGDAIVNGIFCTKQKTILSTGQGQILETNMEGVVVPIEGHFNELGPSRFSSQWTAVRNDVLATYDGRKKAHLEEESKEVADNQVCDDQSITYHSPIFSADDLDMEYFAAESGDTRESPNEKISSSQNGVKDAELSDRSTNEELSRSWKRRLSFEATRRYNHGSRIVGGAGALLSNVVSAVTGSIAGHDDMKITQPMTESTLPMPIDAFHGLTGVATRRICITGGMEEHAWISVIFDDDIS